MVMSLHELRVDVGEEFFVIYVILGIIVDWLHGCVITGRRKGSECICCIY